MSENDETRLSADEILASLSKTDEVHSSLNPEERVRHNVLNNTSRIFAGVLSLRLAEEDREKQEVFVQNGFEKISGFYTEPQERQFFVSTVSDMLTEAQKKDEIKKEEGKEVPSFRTLMLAKFNDRLSGPQQ